MRFFLDTEFIERGRQFPIEMISIGVVAEDRRTFYRVSADFNPMNAGDWVVKNVFPRIAGMTRSPMEVIAAELWAFVSEGGSEKPEFWGYYCDYDWVVMCQMFGSMVELPTGWPMYCNDLKQWAMSRGNPRLPKNSGEHDALEDARWVKRAYEFLAKVEG